MTDDGWRVHVTPEDIRAARAAWSAAQASGACAESVQDLWGDLVRLWRAESLQIAREFWEARGDVGARVDAAPARDVPTQRVVPGSVVDGPADRCATGAGPRRHPAAPRPGPRASRRHRLR